MPKKRVVKRDFQNQQSFIHKEFELVSMAGRCVAGLAPVDHSRIIQPVSTKMMKNCTADFKKIFMVQNNCFGDMQHVVMFLKSVVNKGEQSQQIRCGEEGREWCVNSTLFPSWIDP